MRSACCVCTVKMQDIEGRLDIFKRDDTDMIEKLREHERFTVRFSQMESEQVQDGSLLTSAK